MEALHLGEARLARATAMEQKTRADLEAVAPGLLRRFPIETYIQELDQGGAPHRFWDFTEGALAQNQTMAAAFSKTQVETYNRLLLAHLILHAEARSGRHALVDSVRPFVLENFDRILAGLERPRTDYYLRENHLFRRDKAMARMKVIPCGSELLDIDVAIGRRETLAHGIEGLAHFMMAFGHQLLGQLSPFYESHWDRRFGQYFKACEFKRYYRRVAELMVANPAVRALIGPSWWFDPALREISPELRFLRDTPESGGARFIQLTHKNPHLLQDALAFSPHRKALHAAGKYRPRSLLMVWQRRDLLAWASAQS